MKRLSVLAILLILAAGAVLPGPCEARKKDKNVQQPDFKREEMMMINLNKGPKSAAFYLITSLKTTRQMEKDLSKALNQVRQAETAYARARGHSDSHPLDASENALQQAQLSAEQLEQQLETARGELKDNVKQALINN